MLLLIVMQWTFLYGKWTVSLQHVEEPQQAAARDAFSEAVIQQQQQQRVGLGGYAPVSRAADGEDTEMPDITHEKFPDGAAVMGMPFSV